MKIYMVSLLHRATIIKTLLAPSLYYFNAVKLNSYLLSGEYSSYLTVIRTVDLSLEVDKYF